MFWFEYKYNTTEEILDSIKRIIDFSVLEIAILIGVIVWTIACITYVFPFLMSFDSKRKKEKAKRKRKKLLNQISMQKEIEDEIAAEIEAVNK